MQWFILAVVSGIYLFGGYKFFNGFRKTIYSGGRLTLSLLWPVFFVGSGKFRKNFSKALSGP